MIEALTRGLSGSALARDAIAGGLTNWYADPLLGRDSWRSAAKSIAADFAGRDWLGALTPALQPRGNAGARLTQCGEQGGVVVTTGQQPGLFGGPLYVLHKALTALALANAIEENTGVRAAPVFWAATDDADFAEANHVAVVLRGAVEILGGGVSPTPGRSMAATPLGDIAGDLADLAEACGSAAAPATIAAVRDAYQPGETVGGAYVRLLRELLEPLGISVLDAAHPAVRGASLPVIHRALERAAAVRDALEERSRAIRAAGYRPQVGDVAALSLVFTTDDAGLRHRIPVRDAAEWARDVDAGRVGLVGPNVLLRPIAERSILPTVAYVGGPGEIAYFAQLSAVADVLELPTPRIVPRWSGTLIEPHVRDILTRLGASVDNFRDPHAIEGRVAREEVAPGVREALAEIATVLARESAHLDAEVATSEPLRRSVESMRRGVAHKLARLERRYAASVKQSGTERLHEVASARAALFPTGAPQERVLSFIPFLARYGPGTIEAVLIAASTQMSARVASG